MIEKLVATLFLDRELTHREHLKSKSYAQHIALQGFYENIIDLTDALVEAYQGKYGIIQDIPILTNDATGKDIVSVLELHLDRIKRMRFKALNKEETAIQSLIDDVVICYLSTIYKLKELK